MPRILCALALTALTLPLAAGPTTIAETDIGPVTTDDLAFRIRIHQEVPDDELDSPQTTWRLPGLIEHCAMEKILFHLAEEEGLLDSPPFQAMLQRTWNEHILQEVENRYFRLPVAPPVQEVKDLALELRPRYRMPDAYNWRFMLFSDDQEGHLASAEAALAALSEGASFEEVAQRLSTIPSGSTPGAMIGPTELNGRMLPVIEEALQSLEAGENSGVLETPAGVAIVQLEERITDRYPGELEMISIAGRTMSDRYMVEQRELLVQRLLEKFDPQFFEVESLEAPDDHVLLIIGEHQVTMGDLRKLAAEDADPEASLIATLTAGIPRLLQDHLFIAEMEDLGVTSDPEFVQAYDDNLRYNLYDYLMLRYEEQRVPEPTPEEISDWFAEHESDYVQDLWTVDSLWVSFPTLAAMASSEIGMEMALQMDRLREHWMAGDNPVRVLTERGIQPSFQDGFQSWYERTENNVPTAVIDVVKNMQPGEFSEVIFGPTNATVINLLDHQVGVPSLDDVAIQVRNDIVADRTPDTPFMQEMLEQHHFRQTVDHTKLRWVNPRTLDEIIVLED